MELVAELLLERDDVLVRDAVEDAVEERVGVTVRVDVGVALDDTDALADCVDVILGRELAVETALRELDLVEVAVSVLNAATPASRLSRAGLTSINSICRGGDSPYVVDNTNRVRRPSRRIISLVDSAFFLKVPRGNLNTVRIYNRIIGHVAGADLHNYTWRKKWWQRILHKGNPSV